MYDHLLEWEDESTFIVLRTSWSRVKTCCRERSIATTLSMWVHFSTLLIAAATSWQYVGHLGDSKHSSISREEAVKNLHLINLLGPYPCIMRF